MRLRTVSFLLIVTSAGAVPLPAQSLAQRGLVTRRAADTTNPVLLPSLGGPSEALAVNGAGTIVVGYSWDRRNILHPVRWMLNNGSWVITSLMIPPSATSATARAVDDGGTAAGNDYPSSTSHAVLWSSVGDVVMLGCPGDSAPSAAYAISSGGEIVVGRGGSSAAAWRTGGCREDLPLPTVAVSGVAGAANGDGTVVGGYAAVAPSNRAMPVRWTSIAGQWQVELLDSLPGVVAGANRAGDLAGHVVVPCANPDGCHRAVIWYLAGGMRTLGTLGGEESWARDVNASGEAVGASTAPAIGNTGFFWSESTGMLQLSTNGRWAAANSISDARADGSRVIVGMDSQGRAVVWTLQVP